MALALGTRLGPYEIASQIGMGGMGEVYRATDTNLKRQVAIKVLPDAVATDSERLARFQREAEVLASLNHPNIAAIYGLERADGQTALVMELVEGPTLADRIAQGPIPLDEALPIAKQIAGALEAAHDQGIIHRDLKPANVKITPTGTVKVLDFGLAKAMEPTAAMSASGSISPTITSPAMTQAGVILGTAAYMAPEQARGKTVDRRADIWAFGVVVFEMLTGRRPFGGDEIADTLAFVITKEPDWVVLPSQTPHTVRRLLRRCLEKDSRNRLHDIADARLELQDVADTPEEIGEPAPAAAPWRRAAPWALMMLTVIVAASAIWSTQRSGKTGRSAVVHFSMQLPELSFPVAGGIALSRDGSRLAFVGGPRSQIYVRSLDGIETALLSDTAGASWLSFAPDGQSISFVNPRELRRIAVNGGRSVRLAEVSAEVSPPLQYWRTDDTILFTSKGVLLRVPSGGGTPERVGPPEGAPYVLPRVRLDSGAVFVFSRAKGAELDLQTGTLATVQGPGWPTPARGCAPEYVPVEPGARTGFRICYDSQATTILAAPFDQARLEGGGELRTVLEGVQPIVGPHGAFAVSESGTLAYIAGNVQRIVPSRLVWVDLEGNERALPGMERLFESVALSPDGQRIAMQVNEGTGSEVRRDIWVYDLARGAPSRLTVDERSQGVVWTRDGTRIVHSFTSRGEPPLIRSVSIDGGSIATIAAGQLRWSPTSISPDAKMIAGVGNPGDARETVMSVVHVGDADTSLQPFMDLPPFSESGARFSPDGRFVAYSSDKTGDNEIYVAAYPQGGGEWRVSTDGGTAPRWRSNGRELFYRSGKRMIAVAVDTSAGFHAGTPKTLFERDWFAGPDEPYDVAPDGRGFVMLKAAGTRSTQQELHVIVNWVEELKRLVPMK